MMMTDSGRELSGFDPSRIVAELRNARMMVNYGHGSVGDEPDPLHEKAADVIEELVGALTKALSGATILHLTPQAREYMGLDVAASLLGKLGETTDEEIRAMAGRVDIREHISKIGGDA
jgi:hypothetical protein